MRSYKAGSAKEPVFLGLGPSFVPARLGQAAELSRHLAPFFQRRVFAWAFKAHKSVSIFREVLSDGAPCSRHWIGLGDRIIDSRSYRIHDDSTPLY